jgi:3-oxoacyl-[acyl-carrier protein] reductase
MRLAERVAIVTGGGNGIGQATALRFAEEGAKVVVVDLFEKAAVETVAQIHALGGSAIAIAADVSRAIDVEAMVHATIESFGYPTVLFNNAGVDCEGKKRLIDVAEEDFDRTVAVNLKGVWLGMKYVAPYMIKAGGGAIVNTSSISAFKAGNTAGYAGSKGGVVALSRIAAVELGRHNIRVNTLCPGACLTAMALKMRAEAEARGEPYEADQEKSLSVFGRMAEPIEMANVALFLVSDEASFATGMAFVNDGGWSILSGVEGFFPN